MRISLRFTGAPGFFQRNFILYTDDFRHGPVIGRISGRIVPSPQDQRAESKNGPLEPPVVP
jgi:hypothetical protein